MPLALLPLQALALICAGLALALPAYVFAVLIWSSARSAAADLAEAGSEGLTRLDSLRRSRLKPAAAHDGVVGVPAIQ